MKPDSIHLNEDELASLAIDLEEKQGNSDVENDHVRICKVCSDKLLFFRHFYSNLAAELQKRSAAGTPPPSRPDDNEVVIPFSRFQLNPLSRPERLGESKLILAAKEKSFPSDRYTTVASFSSVTPPAVLRLLEDRKRQQWRIFILSELPEMRYRVRVSLTDSGGKAITVMTNEDGMATLTIPDAFDWTNAHVAVSAKLPMNPPSTTP